MLERIVMQILLNLYFLFAAIWFFVTMWFFAKQKGLATLFMFPLFIALSILWPVIRCREEKETDSWIIKFVA